MKKSLSLILCVLMLFACMSGCAKIKAPQESGLPEAGESQAPGPFETELSETIIFKDSCGREIELPREISRVAPSGAVSQMILFSLAPDLLVGWSGRLSEVQMEYFEKKYLQLPVFGQFYGKNASLNMEALVAADPQVIIDLGDMKDTMAEDMDALMEQTGVPTVFIEATTDTYPEAYRSLGKLLGAEEQAEKIAVYIEQTLALAEQARNEIGDDKLSVMYGSGETGLDCNAYGSSHAAVIELVGAENAIVVQELSSKGGGNTIAMEELISTDPDVILLAQGGPFAKVGSDPYWSGLTAVKNGRVYEIPAGPYSYMGMPPAINQIIGIRWLGNLIYPERFDLDMTAELQAFYKLFWHCDLTQEKARELLGNSTFKAS